MIWSFWAPVSHSLKMPGAVSKLLSYSELQNKHHCFRENLSRVFSLLIIFNVFFQIFFFFSPWEYVFTITNPCVMLGVPDVSPSALSASGLLKFWRLSSWGTSSFLAHGEAQQIMGKLQILRWKEEGLCPKSRWLKWLHEFGILTDPNLLLPPGAQQLNSFWYLWAQPISQQIFEFPTPCCWGGWSNTSW